MSMTGAGSIGSMAAVQARIAQIQSQFTAPAAAPAGSATSSGATAGTSRGTSGDAATAQASRTGAPTATFATALEDAAALVRSAVPVTPAGGGPERVGATRAPVAARGPAAVGPAGGGSGGADVVAGARKYLGVPYVWGGTNPATGLDCSGLVQRVYADLGIELPRVSRDQARAGRPVSSLAEARPGDLLAFNSPVNHIAIYIGNNTMIEAPRPGKNVQVSPVYATPTAIRRVLPPEGAGAGEGVQSLARTSGGGAGGALAGVPYADLFTSAGRRHGVPATLLAEVARAESAFNPRAVSHAGAQGLMQLMPATARGLGVTDSFEPAQAVDGAARLLRDLLDRFGRTDLALAGYNAGPGAVLRYGGVPPYAETQNYVSKIMGRLEVAA